MPINLQGQIIDEQGNLTGGEVNLATGQMTQKNITSPITGQDFTPVSPTDFQGSTTEPITTPKVEDFTPAQPTGKETDISALIKQINTAESALAGESATFRTEEEKRLGFERLKTEEGDLFSQLKQQQAEFENLQAEDVRIEERMQQQATGRGITAGGLQPLTASELRKNFLIKSEKAAQVNVTAAILAGTQNKLLTAQSLVDRAVKNKFGAREAEQAAKINNLERLLKDPTLSVEQANRANAQLAKEKKNQEADTKKKEDAQKILEWAVEARKNGASALEAQQIANIGLSNTPDMAKAFEIYSKFKKEEKITGQSDFEQAFLRDKGRLPTVTELLDFKRREAEAGRAPDSMIKPYVPGSNPTVDNWAKLIISGQAKITEVPNPKGSTLRSDVINAINSSGQLLLNDKDREKLSTLDTAFNVYETIKDLSSKINTFGVGGRVTGFLGRYLGGVTQYNTDIARYNATRQGFVSNVARTLGEKGTLAEGDVQRAINNLPTTNDTKAVAEGKLETLRTILQGAKDSIIQKSTEPLKDVTSGTLNSQPDNLRTKYNY